MYLLARERRILEVLLTTKKETTIRDLAEKLGVSTRTIHRDLKGLESIFEKYELHLAKKAGHGIQVVGDENQKKELQNRISHFTQSEFTPEERQTMIIITLLESKEPTKLVTLAYELNVTVATISNDLDKIQERIEKLGLTLVRKRGYGVEIAGPESGKRKMISQLLFQHFQESELFSFIKDSITENSPDLDAVSEKLLALIDRKKIFIIEERIESLKASHPLMIADSSYVAFVIHLALAIERILRGERINREEGYLDTICKTSEYEIAETISNSLEEVFQVTIPKEEIAYITMHLMGAKLRDRQGYLLEETSLEVGKKVQELIRFVSNEISTDLTNDFSLHKDLVIHLKPALYRIQHHMEITNPLLEKITHEYVELFSIVERGMNKVFHDVKVPREEVGYVVLHFASALLREKGRLHALVVCSSGLGSAKILATRLKMEFPAISCIEQKSFFEVHYTDTTQYDLIVSTVPIANLTEPYFLVSPVLQKDEIASIREFIKNRKAFVRTDRPNTQGNTLQKMASIQTMSQTIVQVLQEFTFHAVIAKSIYEVLLQACQQLMDKGIIQDAKLVLSELLNREKVGGLGIPETSLALYHTRSPAVSRPSFSIYELHQAHTVIGMDNKPMNIHRVLLLLAPSEAPEEMLSVLSHISSLLVADEESIQLFSSGTAKRLHSYLSERLERFFYGQLQLQKE